ncbi:MAG: glycine oxidase ThiO [Stappiaceae bacterium]
MITVLGAGAAGLMFAAMASRIGHEVRIFEQGPEDLSAACAWRAGGMLAPWCEAEIAEPVIGRLGQRSLQIWPDYTDNLELRGSIVLAPPNDGVSLNRFSQRTKNWSFLKQQELDELEPDLSDRFSSGLYYPGEGHLNPRKTLTALVSTLRENGVGIVFDNKQEVTAQSSQDWIIDCRGLAARDTLSGLRGVKGEMMLIRTEDVALNRPVRLIHQRHPIYVVPRTDNVFMIGATTIESEASTGVTVRSAGELLTQVYTLHPAFGEAEIIEFNAGLRPAFADNCPRIHVQDNRLYINGLYRHGIMLAPALAELALNYIETQETDAEVFDVN